MRRNAGGIAFREAAVSSVSIDAERIHPLFLVAVEQPRSSSAYRTDCLMQARIFSRSIEIVERRARQQQPTAVERSLIRSRWTRWSQC